MNPQTFASWPPTLKDQQLELLKTSAMNYAMAKGILMLPVENQNSSIAAHAPFALFPSPFPRAGYEYAVKVQPIFNKLVHYLSQDHAFIEEVFEPLSKADEFTGRLYSIWKKVGRKQTQEIVLGIHRSDYMLHHAGDKLNLYQVELNTISASFASLCSLVCDLHAFLCDRYSYFNDADRSTLDIVKSNLPVNKALEGIADGIFEAYKAYGDPEAIVLMVVQPNERNIFDQRWIEYKVFDRGVKMIRKTLKEIKEQAKILPDESLVIEGKKVAVCYFRSGYGPGDYPTEIEWEARLLVEQSDAIKCPTVAYQLVGAKKVQQVLCKPGYVEKYLSAEESKLVRQSFTGIYSLDNNEEGEDAIQQAVKNPNAFVLKPQREGGGNNYYGEHVKEKLLQMSRQETSAYILMERIVPPPYKNVLIKQGVVVEADVVCELGAYGVFLSKGPDILINKHVGHLLRTKTANTDEGGVAAGFAVIDSPLLFE